MDRDRERFLLEPLAVAVGALGHDHVRLEIAPDGVGGGLGVPTLHVGEDAFPARLVFALLLGRAEEELELHAVGELTPGRVEFELELLGEPGEDHATQVTVGLAPWEDHALENGDRRVAEDQLWARGTLGAEPAAGRAGAEGRVEGEVARLELGHGNATVGAAVLLAEELRDRLGGIATHDLDQTVSEPQCGLERIGEPSAVVGAHDEAVDDHGDVVIDLAIELGRFGEIDQDAVDHGAHEALLARILEEVAELALAATHQRREDLDLDAAGPGEDDVGDLRGRLLGDVAAAVGAVRRAGARVEQAQVVVDLGDGAHGGPRIRTGGLLLDRDRRGEPLDRIDVGFLHEPEELPGIGGERLDVAALAFGEDRVERERRLAATRQPGDDRQLIPGDRDVDVLEIVLAGTAYDQGVTGHSQTISTGGPVYGRDGD